MTDNIENTGEGTLKENIPSDDSNATIITIVLTADNHLGSNAFGQRSWKREERQQRLRRAFQQATDFAIGQGVDLFVQAGDLFDTTTPDEQDRSFVAARLAQLRQAGIRTFALGGTHDTLPEMQPSSKENRPFMHASSAPQMSYARLGALHYFPPAATELEPVVFRIRNVLVGICGLGVLPGQEGDPLERIRVHNEIESAAIPLLILHAPIEGLTTGSSLLDTRAQVSRGSIEKQSTFRYILAGYHHSHRRFHLGRCDVIVAGATQHIDFRDPDLVGEQEDTREPGFVFLGLATDGIRWCHHIAVDTLKLERLVLHSNELWPNNMDADEPTELTPTQIILERLRPLCNEDTMVQLQLTGVLTRSQYHQLDLNEIRRYGEEHCSALAIDDSGLNILPVDVLPTKGESVSDAMEEQEGQRRDERLSPRQELLALVDEWIAAANDEQEKKALRATKEDLLAAIAQKGGF